MQYFVWQGLSPKLKNAFMSVTSKAKPGMTDIIESSFEVLNRLKETSNDKCLNNSSESKENAFSLASLVNINKKAYNVKKCGLCNENHAIYKCIKFNTPERKQNKNKIQKKKQKQKPKK